MQFHKLLSLERSGFLRASQEITGSNMIPSH
jgi:hypothetical protein